MGIFNVARCASKVIFTKDSMMKATFESEWEPIQRQIVATDNKIDQLVYRLYNITEEEQKIIEETTKLITNN
ncbi:MAG: hypothetical protein Q8K98_06400 [Bacteroidota bacterium]|nr:hypothetical protein [Bacteroidota bacterium]